jgi:hypothetical protein
VPLELEGHGVDHAQHVEIDEAVVHRGDDQVGQAVGRAADGRVAAGRVDQHEVGLVAGLGEGVLEAGQGSSSVGLGEVASRLVAIGIGAAAHVGREPGARLAKKCAVDCWRRSRSSTATFASPCSKAVAVWMAMVDLPAPPFSLPTTITLACGMF